MQKTNLVRAEGYKSILKKLFCSCKVLLGEYMAQKCEQKPIYGFQTTNGCAFKVALHWLFLHSTTSVHNLDTLSHTTFFCPICNHISRRGKKSHHHAKGLIFTNKRYFRKNANKLFCWKIRGKFKTQIDRQIKNCSWYENIGRILCLHKP